MPMVKSCAFTKAYKLASRFIIFYVSFLDFGKKVSGALCVLAREITYVLYVFITNIRVS